MTPYMALLARQCTAILQIMKRRADDQITLRLAGELRAALEKEAAAESRGLSGQIRKILLDHSTRRITERAGAETGAAH